MSIRSDRGDTVRLLVAAFDAASLPVLLHDDERIIFANSAAATILGAAPGQDIAGMSLDSFLVPDLASVTKERRAYLMGHHVRFNDLPIKMRTLDGRTISLRVDARPLSIEGATIGMVTLAGAPDAS